jgi:NitT/TauT family transport system substrate-binding protein
MRRAEALTSLAAASIFAGKTMGIAEAQTSAPALETIRIAAVESDALTPLFYAMRNGTFQRAGIDIQFISTASGSAAITAVLAGEYEMANPSLMSVMAGHLRGVPLVVVAPQAVYTRRNPFGLLQVAPDSALRTAADLNGKIVGVLGLNNFTDLVVRVWADQNGGDSKTLKFVEIPFALTETAIVQHRVDAGLMLEPLLSASLTAGKTRTLGDVMGSIAPTYMFGAFIARSDWASQHADLVRRFVHVMENSATYTNAHPAQTAAMMAEVTKIPLAVMQKMKRVVSATKLDPILLQPLIEAAAKYNLLSRSFPADEIFWSGAN